MRSRFSVRMLQGPPGSTAGFRTGRHGDEELGGLNNENGVRALDGATIEV
jgi:hypothetical protein